MVYGTNEEKTGMRHQDQCHFRAFLEHFPSPPVFDAFGSFSSRIEDIVTYRRIPEDMRRDWGGFRERYRRIYEGIREDLGKYTRDSLIL